MRASFNTVCYLSNALKGVIFREARMGHPVE